MTNDKNSNPWLSFRQYEESDAGRFKGRDRDIKNLFHLVEASDIAVLYAESGIGKSSLVKAGLVPNLRGNMYLPIPFIFTEDVLIGDNPRAVLEKSIREQILSELSRLNKQLPEEAKYQIINEFESCEEGVLKHSLWWFLRTRKIVSLNFDVTPVIVFDQFEEIFKLRRGFVEAFFDLLHELSLQRIPESLIEQCTESQLPMDGIPCRHFKMLFSLREEYIGQLDYWGIQQFNVPALKNNRYSLQPLTHNQATEIITTQGVNTLNNISDKIIEQSKETGKEYISTLILSVLCSKLYDLARESSDGTKIPYSDNEMPLSTVALVGEYYSEIMKELRISKRVRKVIESTLVSEDGKRLRVPVSDPNLERIYFKKDFLNELDEKHIIKKTEINNVEYVELVHDKVAEVVAIGKRKIMANRTRKRSLLTALILAIVIILSSILFHIHDYIRESPSCWIEGENSSNRTMFFSGPSFTYLELDDSTSGVGKYVIKDCPNLRKVVIRRCSRSVSPRFINCPNLTEIVFGEGIKTLSWVSSCPRLKRVYIPSTLEYSISFPFEGRLNVDFIVSKKNPYYYQKDGVLWSRADSTWSYWDIKSINEDDISAEEETIQFNVGGIDSTVVRFVYYARFPESLLKNEYNYRGHIFKNSRIVGNQFKFKDDNKEVLEKVRSVPDSILDFSRYPLNNVKKINEKAVQGNDEIIQLDFLGSKVTDIYAFAFMDCKNLQKVRFNSGISLGSYAFVGCSSIDSLSLKNVRKIGSDAFGGCEGLRFMVLPDSVSWETFSLGSSFNTQPLHLLHCETVFSENSIYQLRDSVVFDSVGNVPVSTMASYHTYNDDQYFSAGGILAKKDEKVFIEKILDIPSNANYEAFRKYFHENKQVAIANDNCVYLGFFTSPRDITISGFALVDKLTKVVYLVNGRLNSKVRIVNEEEFANLREIHLFNSTGNYLDVIVPKQYRSNITVFVPKRHLHNVLSRDFIGDYKAVMVESWLSLGYNLYRCHYIDSLPFIAEYRIIIYPLLAILFVFLGVVIFFKAKTSPQWARVVLSGFVILLASVVTWFTVYWAIYTRIPTHNVIVSNLVSLPLALSVFFIGMSQFVAWRDILRTIKNWIKPKLSIDYWKLAFQRFREWGGRAYNAMNHPWQWSVIILLIVALLYIISACYYKKKGRIRQRELDVAVEYLKEGKTEEAATILGRILPRNGCVSTKDTAITSARILFQQTLNREQWWEYPYHYGYYDDKQDGVIELSDYYGNRLILNKKSLQPLGRNEDRLVGEYFLSYNKDTVRVRNLDSTLVRRFISNHSREIVVSSYSGLMVNPINSDDLEIRDKSLMAVDTLKSNTRYSHYAFNSSGTLFKRDVGWNAVEIRDGHLNAIDTLFNCNYYDVSFKDDVHRILQYSKKDNITIVRDEKCRIVREIKGKIVISDDSRLGVVQLTEKIPYDYEVRDKSLAYLGTLNGYEGYDFVPGNGGLVCKKDSVTYDCFNKGLKLKRRITAQRLRVKNGVVLVEENFSKEDGVSLVSVYDSNFKKKGSFQSEKFESISVGQNGLYYLIQENGEMTILNSDFKTIGHGTENLSRYTANDDYVRDASGRMLLLINPSKEQWETIIKSQ